MSWLSNFFGGGGGGVFGAGGVKEALRRGAVIIDLRTAYEYDQGISPTR
ncbi:hypothetical protein ACQ86N_40455 [Puia sp. P3]